MMEIMRGGAPLRYKDDNFADSFVQSQYTHTKSNLIKKDLEI